MIGHSIRRSTAFLKPGSLFVATALLLAPVALRAQTSTGERWLHVRVVSTDNQGETVCVNVPLELAEKILPSINKKELHDGKVTIDKFDTEGVDFRAVLEAVRNSKDGEFVTVNGNNGEDVRVAKQGGFLLVHVTDVSGREHHAHFKHGDSDSADQGAGEKSPADKKQSDKATATAKVSHVEVKVPLSVIDALLSGKKDELDLVAGLRTLSAQGDTELVSVKDGEDTVRVWVDSKNTNGSDSQGVTR
jgi:hypothetical protein